MCFPLPEAEFAAAVLLVVELAGEDVAAFVQAALAPVAVPEAGQAAAALLLCVEAGLADLAYVLPSGRG